jgi:DNA-binding NarL/FixJ family response regulator
MATDSGVGILVVDDDEAFRSYVIELLEGIGFQAGGIASGAAVVPAVAAAQPEAIVLDVQLPGLNGYEVCRQLRDLYGDSIAIIFISGERIEAMDRAAGLLVGADDYMIKPVDAAELIARIRRSIERTRSNGREDGVKPANLTGKLASLTQREREVLDLLAEGLRQEEIAGRLVISPKTVATHIQRILGKLEVRNRAQAVALALREERDVSGHAADVPLEPIA